MCSKNTTTDDGLYQEEGVFLCWTCFQNIQDAERRQDMGDHYTLIYQDGYVVPPPVVPNQLQDDPASDEEEENEEEEEENEEEGEFAVQQPFMIGSA